MLREKILFHQENLKYIFSRKIQKTLSVVVVFMLLSGSGLSFAKNFIPDLLSPRAADFRTKVIIQAFLNSQHIHSLEDYAQWVALHIRYQKDTDGDYWARPEETLKKGFGDCEDLAFLHQVVLSALGYKAQTIAFGHQGYTHALCVFRINGFWAIFDNTQLIITKTDSIKKIIVYLGKKQNPSYFLELSLNKDAVKFFLVRKSQG